VVHPKRLTSLRDEWRLIGVHHPSFYSLTVDDTRHLNCFWRTYLQSKKPCGGLWIGEWLSCGTGFASTDCLNFSEQQHASWGRQMWRHSSRSDVSRVCLPQLASPRTEDEDKDKDAKKKSLSLKTRSPCTDESVLWSPLTSLSDMSFAHVLTSCARCAQWPYRPAAALRAAALSVRSQVNSGSSRPKWP
jgi:hypothetical protein